MNFKRSERVSELLRHEISSYVQQMSNPRLGFVTVTGVRLSDDLSDAKIFFSVYGSDEQRQITSEILHHAIPSLRHDLGKKLESLRRIPALSFVYDHTPEKAQRVSEILDQLSKERIDEAPGKNLKPAKSVARKAKGKSSK